MEERAKALQTNSPSLTFKDISNLFLQRFKLSMEEKKMIRFMDAENFKIITKRDYLIYSRSVQQTRNFIIQIGKTELISPSEIGVEKDSQAIIEKIKTIAVSLEQFVEFDNEMKQYLSLEEFTAMKTQIQSPHQITSTKTKMFFKIEAHITALEFCLVKIKESVQFLRNQIYCEKINLDYNRSKLAKQVDQTRADFERTLQQKQDMYDQFQLDIEKLNKVVIIGKSADTAEEVIAGQMNEFFDSV